jgi:hypothetical protein
VIAAAAAAIASSAVIATPRASGAGVVEGVVSCPTEARAGLHTVRVGGTVTVPGRYPGGVFVWSVFELHAGKVVSQVEFNTAAPALIVDRGLCRPRTSGPPFTGKGLLANGTVTPDFVGQLDDTCTLAAARVLVHYRVTFARGGAVRGTLAVATDDRRRTPVAFLDWRPTRLTSFLGSHCRSTS